MRRIVLAIAVCSFSTSLVNAQETVVHDVNPVGMPGMMYSGSIGAGCGGQLYPYDRQDPWLHGHFQRMPAYGGFASFRPYNYRHVFAQRQIATGVWGSSHGQPYSQQFWNRYRTDYLNGNLHSQASARPTIPESVSPVGYPGPRSASVGQPIHVYPSEVQGR